MKIQVEVKTLPMVVALFLALGVSNGLVIDKCELGEDLNSTLPAKILDQINNLVAKIVCHVELSSYLNTSTINYVTGPNIKSFIRVGRKGRSAESSNEESSAEDVQEPKNDFSSHPEGNTSDSDEAQSGRKRRSAESSSEESSEEDIPRSKRVLFNSLIVNPVTRPEGNTSDSDEAQSGRKRRSSESSSEESSEEDIPRSKSVLVNSLIVNPVTRPEGNTSDSDEAQSGRKRRSAENSSEESDNATTWTLYGLFQLPDRIACTSGFKPSLNLCGMHCDSLIDDDIRDDITCVETILNKMAAAFFQKECKNVQNSGYFSTC